MRLILILLALCAFALPAQARHHLPVRQTISRDWLPVRHFGFAMRQATHVRRETHRRARRHWARSSTLPLGPARSGLVTVPTAAGINITVASEFAEKFTGFIKDLVDAGYKPKWIGCYAPRAAGGAHPLGAACDFDQSGRNATAKPMYALGNLAAMHGLRDGCSWGPKAGGPDCGHIEDASRVYVLNHRIARRWRPGA